MPLDPRAEPEEMPDPDHLREVRDATEEFARRAAAASERAADAALSANRGVAILQNAFASSAERMASQVMQTDRSIGALRDLLVPRLVAVEAGLARLSAVAVTAAPSSAAASSERRDKVSGGLRFRLSLDDEPGERKARSLARIVRTWGTTVLAVAASAAWAIEHFLHQH